MTYQYNLLTSLLFIQGSAGPKMPTSNMELTDNRDTKVNIIFNQDCFYTLFLFKKDLINLVNTNKEILLKQAQDKEKELALKK